MSKKNARQQLIRVVLAISLMSSQAAVANPAATSGEGQWIFPGQELPADVGYVPTQASSDPGAPIQVMPRDWFLLRDRDFLISQFGEKVPEKGRRSAQVLDYTGPVLDDINAQFYYRLVSGMILKESLVQLGLSPMQARRFIDRASEQGLDFETAELSELGRLPNVIDDLYANWDRPMNRLAILPYALLPLTVAYDQSDLQHFYRGAVEGPADRSCQTASHVAPISSVQVQLDEKRQRLDELDIELRTAEALLEQSNSELMRLTSRINQLTTDIDTKRRCYDQIGARVAKGSALPGKACLDTAQSVLEASKMEGYWEKFVNSNLANDKGDFKVRQELETNLKVLEAKLQMTVTIAESLKDSRDKIMADQAKSEETIASLMKDRLEQEQREVSLTEEQEKLNQEFQELQSISHKLERGTLSQELSDDEVKAAIAATPERKARIDEIKKLLPLTLEKKGEIQANHTAISTQIEFTTKQIETSKSELAAIESQLGDKNSGMMSEVANLEKQVQEANQAFLEASDEYNFSEYVISMLTRDLIAIAKERDSSFEALRKETALAAAYKERIAEARAKKDQSVDDLANEVTGLEQLLAIYKSPQHMGWYLEDDCTSRKYYDQDGAGVYLARAPLQESTDADGIDGGRWGLFNLDYKNFQSSIDSGVLLDVAATIELAVREITSNYDYAATQFLDPNAKECNALAAQTSVTSSVLTFMKSAFAIWDEGSSNEAKATGYCRIGEDSQSPAGADNRKFASNLSKMIEFKGSLLDQVLPHEGQSRGEDLIERRAVQALSEELALATGLLHPSKASFGTASERRDNLIKALIRVLAFDYEAAIRTNQEQMTPENGGRYLFASAAPGKIGDRGNEIAAGNSYRIQTIAEVKLYSKPQARAENETGVSLSWNDEVRVESLGEPQTSDALRAGWIMVTAKNQRAWMPVWPITYGGLVDGNGEQLYDLSSEQKCPVRRLVQVLTNFDDRDKVVTRILPDIKTEKYRRADVWRMSWKGNRKDSPAFTDRLYVACETFSLPGQIASDGLSPEFKNHNGIDYSQVQGIRIVEVRKWISADGVERYLPVEQTGGFVHTWLPVRSEAQPRILLGPELDAETWSVK